MKNIRNLTCWATYITLTVDVHPDGLDGRGAEAVLSLAVVATSLGPQNLCNVQRLVEHTGVLEAVRHTASRLGPSDLGRTKGRNDYTSRSDFNCSFCLLVCFQREKVRGQASNTASDGKKIYSINQDNTVHFWIIAIGMAGTNKEKVSH